MKRRLISTLLLVSICLLACSDKVNILSAIKNGEKLEEGTQVEFMLSQNYPNPFNPMTFIHYKVFTVVHLTMKVYTEDWQEVSTLLDREHEPGDYSTRFDSRNTNNEEIPSGEYFYTLEGNGLILIRRMKIVK